MNRDESTRRNGENNMYPHRGEDREIGAEGDFNFNERQHRRNPDFERLANLVVVSGEDAVRAMTMKAEEQCPQSPRNTEIDDDSPLSDYKCVICLGVFINACGIPCGHKFCRLCINKWLRARSKPVCPICRTDVQTSPDPLPEVDEFVGDLYGTLLEDDRTERANSLKRRVEEEKAEMARIEQQLMGVPDAELQTLQLFEALEVAFMQPALSQEHHEAQNYRNMLLDLADYSDMLNDEAELSWRGGRTTREGSRLLQEPISTYQASASGNGNFNSSSIRSIPVIQNRNYPLQIPILAFPVSAPQHYPQNCTSDASVQTGHNASDVRPPPRFMPPMNYNGRNCPYPSDPTGLRMPGGRSSRDTTQDTLSGITGGPNICQVQSRPTQDLNAQGYAYLHQPPNWPGNNGASHPSTGASRNGSPVNPMQANNHTSFRPDVFLPPSAPGFGPLQSGMPTLINYSQNHNFQELGLPRPSHSAFTLPFPCQVQNFQSFVPLPSAICSTPRLDFASAYLNAIPPPLQSNVGTIHPVPIPIVRFMPGAQRQRGNSAMTQNQTPGRRSPPTPMWNSGRPTRQYSLGPQQWAPPLHQQSHWPLDASPQGLVPLPFGFNDYLHFNFGYGSSNPSSVTGIAPVMDRPRVRATPDPMRPNTARVQLTFNITYPPL